jgi:hypothetical protein
MFQSLIFRTTRLAATAALTATLATPSFATLTGADLYAPGDQFITVDSDTGLSWLDLTATLNLSAHDILNGAGGWKSAGFRYATSAEVAELFLHSDANAVLSNGTSMVSAQNLPGALALLQLLGTTYVQPPGNDFNVVGSGLAGVNEPATGWLWGATYGTNIDSTGGFFFVPDGQFALSFSDPGVGSYLVSGGPVVTVPEPPVAALALAGWVLLRVWRRS